jgi:XTP/dITP diphosphohydrolase
MTPAFFPCPASPQLSPLRRTPRPSKTLPARRPSITADSGLEVAALQGAPGVRSARYAADAGFHADATTDGNNNLFLLQELTRIPESERGARYQCVLAAARDGAVLLSAQGTVEGRILSTPRGSNGFGYDPLFYLPARACTMAEMDDQTKWTLSHRGQAFRALLELLA